MKTLETQFTKSGWTYVQECRQGDFAIYHRTKGRIEDWEVIRIQSHDEGSRTVKKDGEEIEIKYEAGESYPTSESWGTNGWTYTTKLSALQKMERLLSEAEVKA